MVKPRLSPALALLPLIACDTASTPAPTPNPEPTVTWHAHVAPLLAEHCVGCHTENGAGPFPLDDLASARHHAELSLAAMRAGVMPPWMPARDCRTYQDERGVTPTEIATFATWVSLGTPEGDPTTAPPTARPAAPWTPSVTTNISTAHVPRVTPSGETDDYHCFVLDLTFPSDTYLRASQVVAGSSQVHHVLVYAIGPERAAAIAAADAADPRPGYTCFGGPIETGGESESLTGFFAGGPMPNLVLPAQIAGWVPGSQPVRYPNGTAMRIAAGSVIVAQVHYNLSEGAPQPDTTRLELELSDAPPDTLVDVRPLAVRDLTIPKGEAEATNVGRFPYYGDTPKVIASVTAHMHLLGARFRAEVERPGDTAPECALDIPRWDFHWQQAYRLPDDQHITLEDGDTMRVTCVHDNARGTSDVRWGEGTADEMCILYYSSVRPFSAAPTPPATPCAPTADCLAACAGPPSLDCVFACPTADITCSLCALREGLRCANSAQAPCLQQLLAAQQCLGTCLGANVMLGSNPGRCFAAECGPQYAAMLACMDAPLTSPSCAAGLAACGIDFAD